MGTRKRPRRTQGRIQRLASDAIAGIMARANEPKGRRRFAWRGKEHGRVVTGVCAAANHKQVHDALRSVGVAVKAYDVTAWKAPTRKQLERRKQDRARRDAAKGASVETVSNEERWERGTPIRDLPDDDAAFQGNGGNERGVLLEPPRL